MEARVIIRREKETGDDAKGQSKHYNRYQVNNPKCKAGVKSGTRLRSDQETESATLLQEMRAMAG